MWSGISTSPAHGQWATALLERKDTSPPSKASEHAGAGARARRPAWRHPRPRAAPASRSMYDPRRARGTRQRWTDRPGEIEGEGMIPDGDARRHRQPLLPARSVPVHRSRPSRAPLPPAQCSCAGKLAHRHTQPPRRGRRAEMGAYRLRTPPCQPGQAGTRSPRSPSLSL